MRATALHDGPVIPAEARDAAAPPPSGGPSAVARLKALATGWRDPQSRDGMALVLSSAVSSAVGLLYWVVAARMFDPTTVGINTTVVSTLGLLGIIAQLNLGSAMLRFVPVVGRGARTLVAACYATGIGAAVVIGTGFALGAGWWAPELQAAVGAGALVAYFALATPFWTVFNMQDYLLTGIKRATVVPFENLGFALLKIVLLVVGGLLGFSGAIAGSWALGTAVTVVAITIYLLRVLPPHQPKAERPPSPVTLRSLRGFVAADWVGSMCLTLVNFGLPLLVFARLGADSAATFGVTWQLAYALYLVPTGMGQSLVAHVGRRPVRAGRRVPADAHQVADARGARRARPARAGSWLVLMVFGEHYAETGSAAARARRAVGRARVREPRRDRRRPGAPAARRASTGSRWRSAVIVIPAVWVLMPRWGLTGVGVALVGGQGIVAAGGAAAPLRPPLGQRLTPADPDRGVASCPRQGARRGAGRLRRRLRAVGTAGRGVRRRGIAGGGDARAGRAGRRGAVQPGERRGRGDRVEHGRRAAHVGAGAADDDGARPHGRADRHRCTTSTGCPSPTTASRSRWTPRSSRSRTGASSPSPASTRAPCCARR